MAASVASASFGNSGSMMMANGRGHGGSGGGVRRSTMQGTVKPLPPPKPSHLSSVFTGTLNSDALKSYIRQHSKGTIGSRTNTSYTAQTDTFRTSREHDDTFRALTASNGLPARHCQAAGSETDEEEGEDEAAWGTARQSPSPMGKPALFDLFSPLTIPGSERMDMVAEPDTGTASQITVRARADTPTRSLSPEPADASQGQEQVPTIKLGKAVLHQLTDLLEEQRRSDDGFIPHHDSRTPSSDGTVRSREPSILSRLSAFDDDEDDAMAGMGIVNGPNKIGAGAARVVGVPADNTPRKKWMHARDGSAFERASPRPSKGSKMSRQGSKASQGGNKTGLPTLSDGLPLLVAGPPPIQPQSVLADVSEVEKMAEQNPTQSMENGLRPPSPNVTTLNKSNLSSRRREVQRGAGRQARALYAFEGESTFNELALAPGQVFEILKEDVQDGWSLAAAEQAGVWTKGLVPRGWYTYIKEFTASPSQERAPGQSDTPSGATLDSGGAVSNDSLLVPAIRTHTAISCNSDKTNTENTQQDQASLEHDRPASGVGQMSASYSQSGGAMQILTQMKRNSSSTSLFKSSGSSSRIVSQPIRVAEAQDMRPTDSSSSAAVVSDDSLDTSAPDEMGDSQTSIDTATSSTTWRPPGILGGRMLNRFAPFVISGAEQYILTSRTVGDAHVVPSEANNDVNTVISGQHGGPAWKYGGLSIIVEVHSPEVHVDERNREYTAYVVHTSYVLSPEDKTDAPDHLLDPYIRPEEPSMTSSVYRRFNHFRWLSNHLHKLYPAIMLTLPPMPSASHGAGWSTRFEAPFVERRRRHLQSWLLCVVRHPLLAKDAGLRFFLDSEDEGEQWLQGARAAQEEAIMLGKEGSQSEPASQLFARTLHPMFNIDTHEAAEEAKQMTHFADVYERTMCASEVGMLSTYKDVRSATASSSESFRNLSLAVLRLITGADPSAQAKSTIHSSPASSKVAAAQGVGVLPPMGNVGRRSPSGATNEDRAWCWREGCLDCRRLTSAMQVTAEAFQVVADDYRAHADGGLFELHDRLWNLSKAHQQQASLIEVHKSALTMYCAATGELGHGMDGQEDVQKGAQNSSMALPNSQAAERIAARCETVLNVTMGEMDRIHSQRVQDWNALARQLLDEQVSFYEDVLHNLRRAQARVGEVLGVTDKEAAGDANATSETHPSASAFHIGQGPLLPSPYETQLATPIVHGPLEMPTMQLTEPSAASKAIHPVALAGEVLSDWLGGGHGTK